MILETVQLKSIRGYDNHKYVIETNDSKTGLHAIVAIHNNNLGPATGGTRIFSYRSRKEAITDALQLSKAMTYKCALARVRHGGGKGVIIADSAKNTTEALLKSYAEFINQINAVICSFTTGEDMGMNGKDVELMGKHSFHFVGTSKKVGGPSPFAALSTYYAMKSAIRSLYGKNSFRNVSVAIKGVGKVGACLMELLVKDGAKVFISDIDGDVVRKLTMKHKGYGR